MIRSKHNLYVSTPNWFTSQTITDTAQSKQSVVLYNSTTNVTTAPEISDVPDNKMFLNIYNKSLQQLKSLTNADLTFAQCAISTSVNTIGQTITDENWISTGYIEIVSGSELKINTSYDSSGMYGIALYDLSKKCINAFKTSDSEQRITIPSNVRYFRACSKKDESFSAVYRKPSAYNSELLSHIYDGNIDPFTSLKYPFQETISTHNCQLQNVSIVVDDPLKIEIDSNGNMHLNINGLMGGTGNFVTTTGEALDIIGIKTFEKGIGIGNYLIVPDTKTESLKLVHKDNNKLGNLYTTGWLSAYGASASTATGSQATSLYQLIDVEKNDDGTAVKGAEKGSVLKYNGTHWYADVDEGFDTDKLDEYLTNNEFLTKDAADKLFLTLKEADDLFLTPEEGDALFLTLAEGDLRYLLKSIFSNIFTAYNSDGEELDITDTSTAIDNISVNYNFWSKGYVSALGKQTNASADSATSLYQLMDVKANTDNTSVDGAEKGSVLTYDGTHWCGSKITASAEIDENKIIAINDKYKYATQTWVEDKKYITDAYSKKEVDDKVSTINTSIKTTNTNVTNLTTKVNNLILVVEKEEDATNGDNGVLYILQQL